MVASSALRGSISVTTTSAPMPFARMASPRPQQLYAGGGLLGPADHVLEQLAPVAHQAGDQVAAVVHGQVRLVVERGLDVVEVGVAILALDRVDADAVVDQRRRH